MRWGAAILGIVLLVPFASASTVEGVLEASGPIDLPAKAVATSEPLVLFVADATTGKISGNASRLSVQVFETRYATANAVLVKPSVALPNDGETSWSVLDARFDAEPLNAGYVGIRPGDAQLRELNSLPGRLLNEKDVQIGNGVSGADSREDAGFLVALEGPAVTRSADSWTLTGETSVKLFGPVITIVGRENVTRIETGEWSDPDAPGQIVRRWVILDSNEATISGEGASTQIASSEVRVEFDGTVTIPNASGNLRDALEEWHAEGHDTLVDGALVMVVSPLSGEGSVALHLTGELRGSTMTSRVAFPSARGPGIGIGVGILVALAAMVGTAGSAYCVRRRRAARRGAMRERIDVDDLAALADRAADAGEFDRAASLLEQARRDAPTSRRLALDHAYFVLQGGDAGRALQLLEDPLLRDDPDALILHTRIHARRGELEKASESLVRALDAAPLLALDIEGDAAYDALLEREHVRAALGRARRRIS